LQAGIGGEVVGCLLIGTGATGGPTHKPGDCRGVGTFESEKVVKRATTGPGFRMIMVVAP
jgi:hypothetical protein